MHVEYLPNDLEGMKDHILEEMGEVLVAHAKIKRFGEFNYDPTIPEDERITNLEAFHQELYDLEGAIGRYFQLYFKPSQVHRAEEIF